MGLFDTVFTECPNCGNKVRWHISSDSMDFYHVTKVPFHIARQLMHEEAKCDNCETTLRVGPPEPPRPEFVCLDIQKV